MKKFKSLRRRPFSLILFLLVRVAALATACAFVILVGYILIKGVPHLSWDLFALEYNSTNVSLLPVLINTISIVGMIPMIAIFFFFQKYMIKGLVAGAVKG